VQDVTGLVVLVRFTYALRRAVTALLVASATVTCMVTAAVPAQATPAPICQAQQVNGQTLTNLATQMSTDIQHALAGRTGTVAVDVNDPTLGITCALHTTGHFDSASVVKATILAALLHRDEVQHRSLTAHEKSLAYSMITASNNNSATALWNDVGMTWLQRFLNLAQMNQTVLGLHGYWGLTQITAGDETLLLWLLLNPNSVLTPTDQQYELGLMAKVISAQRFGVPAGTPKGFTVHVKNGWAPLPAGTDPWYVNSIGAFTNGTVAYTIVVLTHQTRANPQFAYGVKTIENVAVKVHADLNSGAGPAVPRSTPNATWGIPDEQPPGPSR
jgi:hypothetical protein